jgi:tRNA 2-thiouridine synthesizing protein A
MYASFLRISRALHLDIFSHPAQEGFFSDQLNTQKKRSEFQGERMMAVKILDTLGLKCPQPVLKIAVMAPEMKKGDILEVMGDCPTFEKDIRAWCERLGKVLLSVREEPRKKKTIQIQF